MAKLEGLSGAWVMTAVGDVGPVIREPKDWHPYNVNAEREARSRMEGSAHDLDF